MPVGSMQHSHGSGETWFDAQWCTKASMTGAGSASVAAPASADDRTKELRDLTPCPLSGVAHHPSDHEKTQDQNMLKLMQ